MIIRTYFLTTESQYNNIEIDLQIGHDRSKAKQTKGTRELKHSNKHMSSKSLTNDFNIEAYKKVIKTMIPAETRIISESL